MKLRISMKEAVFTVDNDGDGQAEVPVEREGETMKPNIDLDGGLSDSNNDGSTDTYSDEELIKKADEEGEPMDQLNQQIPDEALPGDDELAAELAALQEDESLYKGEKIKLVIRELNKD